MQSGNIDGHLCYKAAVMVGASRSDLDILWLTGLLQEEVEPRLSRLEGPVSHVFILEWNGDRKTSHYYIKVNIQTV